MEKITEQTSHYDNLEQMSTQELLTSINHEDQSVPLAVEKTIPMVTTLVDAIVERMQKGGRVFYIGAGTSGRLGVLDASELPPTFGVLPDMFIGLIAGGDHALRNAVEHAEDDETMGWQEIQNYHPTTLDTVIGITASGTTPYVIGAVRKAREHGLLTGCITSNPGTTLAALSEYPIEVIVGPEFVTGSSRMKSGSAQKMILNMISSAVMIHLGHVKGNRMVDLQLCNDKLIDRGVRMVMSSLGISRQDATLLLQKYGSVREAIDSKI